MGIGKDKFFITTGHSNTYIQQITQGKIKKMKILMQKYLTLKY